MLLVEGCDGVRQVSAWFSWKAMVADARGVLVSEDVFDELLVCVLDRSAAPARSARRAAGR